MDCVGHLSGPRWVCPNLVMAGEAHAENCVRRCELIAAGYTREEARPSSSSSRCRARSGGQDARGPQSPSLSQLEPRPVNRSIFTCRALLPRWPCVARSVKDSRRAHYIHAGRMRAAFWRKLGFPNLVLARARQAELRAQRSELIAAGYSKEEAKALVKARHSVDRAKAGKKPEGRNAQALLLSDRDL